MRAYDIDFARNDQNNTLAIGIADSTGTFQVLDNINFNPTDGLHYYEIDYHHATQTLEIFGDNQLIYSNNSITIPRVARYIALGFCIGTGSEPSYASVDEFFILDGVAKSSGTCTVPTEPLEVTENTLSLLHFE